MRTWDEQMEKQPTGGEQTISTELTVKAVTNFQIIPENGGFVLILGARRLHVSEDAFGKTPLRQVDPIVAAFLSHGMLKDLTRVLTASLSHFETTYGVIPIPLPSALGNAEPLPRQVKPKSH
jgi:hypothetical protein